MIRSLASSMVRTAWKVRVIRYLALAATYSIAFAASLVIAYLLRFDFDLPSWVMATLLPIGAAALGVKLMGMVFFHQFDGLLTYFSRPDLRRLVFACASSSLVLGLIRLVEGVQFAPPRGVLLIDLLLCIVILSSTRLGFRWLRTVGFSKTPRFAGKTRCVGIIGAGDSGAGLARELQAKPWLGLQPVAFLDDHRDTKSSVHGIPVIGTPERMEVLKDRWNLEEIIIAMPAAPARRIREIVQLAQQANLPCRTVPGLDQLATGRVSVSSIRPVEIADLLGRAPVEVKVGAVREIIQGSTVMVTGAGGSIGSELCRQILSFGPARLLLVERSEPQLFAIEQELRAAPHGELVVPLVADIGNRARMREIFRRFQPAAVFHAAAHKHVPMMEMQPDEAIRNNVLATAQLGELAVESGVERFVFISTDKAVNPTSVMGATKRLAEIYLQSLTARLPKTKFMAVRFGNVLGSSGSVVPIFTRQIAAGGPVTITHPEMTRFFMTIPEAVTLVLQSSALGKGGDIFILDMGKPMPILDLAHQMIALSGLKPHEDIEIAFTGLRPGEKLYEELSHGHESVTVTEHPKITRLLSPPMPPGDISLFLADLADALDDGVFDPATLRELLVTMVPEYTPFHPADPPPGGLPAESLARTGPALVPPGLPSQCPSLNAL